MVDTNIDQQMEDILNVTGDDPLSDAMGDRLITQQTDNIAEDIGDVATDVIRSLDVPEMAMRYQDAMNYEPMSNTERLLRIFPAADIIGAGVGSGAKAPINALASNAIRREAKKDIIKPQGRGSDIQFADYAKQALEAQGKIELPDGTIISEAPFKYSDDIIKIINTTYDSTTVKGLTSARKAGLGKKVPEGKLVAVRPNLNSDINDEAVPIPKIGKPDEPKKQPLLSVQEGGKVKGTVYADQPYVLVNPTKDKGVVSFTVDQNLRAEVAGGANKDRLMAVRGEYTEYDISKFSINSPDVVEIKFNPALQHLAIRADTNEALVGSKGKVLIIADRIYALKDDLIYARKRDAPKALGGHDTNVVYRLNKGGLLDDQMEDILNVEGDDPLTDAQTDALGVYRGEPERDPKLVAQETDMLLDVAGGDDFSEFGNQGPLYGGPDKKLDSQDALALFFPPIPGIDPIFGETKKAFEEGRYGTGLTYAALTLLGIIPGAKTVTKPAAKKLSKEVAKDTDAIENSKKPITSLNTYDLPNKYYASYNDPDIQAFYERSNINPSTTRKIDVSTPGGMEKEFPNSLLYRAKVDKEAGNLKETISLNEFKKFVSTIPSDQAKHLGLTNLLEEAIEKDVKKISRLDIRNRIDNNQIILTDTVYYNEPPYSKMRGTSSLDKDNAIVGRPQWIKYSELLDDTEKMSELVTGTKIQGKPSALLMRGVHDIEPSTMKPSTRDMEKKITNTVVGYIDDRQYKEITIGTPLQFKERPLTKAEIESGTYIDNLGEFQEIPPYVLNMPEPKVAMRVRRDYKNLDHFGDATDVDVTPIVHVRLYNNVTKTSDWSNPQSEIKRTIVSEIQSDANKGKNVVADETNPKTGIAKSIEETYSNTEMLDETAKKVLSEDEKRNKLLSKIKGSVGLKRGTLSEKEYENLLEQLEFYQESPRTRTDIRYQDIPEQERSIDNPQIVPDLPFKKRVGKIPQWSTLGVKRAIKEAIENGSDEILFATDVVQSIRYNGNIGEGTKQYYSSILPKTIEKIAKENGINVNLRQNYIKLNQFQIRPGTNPPARDLIEIGELIDAQEKLISTGKLDTSWLPDEEIINITRTMKSISRYTKELKDRVNKDRLMSVRGDFTEYDASKKDDLQVILTDFINTYGENHPFVFDSAPYWVMDVTPELKKLFNEGHPRGIEFNKGGTIDKEMGQLFAN
tara:strand:+ start:6140 stop:9727 length:3588 start_codon:yes stop_codon:yes gene_type:complete